MRSFYRACDECLESLVGHALVKAGQGELRESASILQCPQGHKVQRWLIMGSDEQVWGAATSRHGSIVWASEAEAWAARDYADDRCKKLAEQAKKCRAKAWTLRRERIAWGTASGPLKGPERGRGHWHLYGAVLEAAEAISDKARTQTKRAKSLEAIRTDMEWMFRLAERQARHLHRMVA